MKRHLIILFLMVSSQFCFSQKADKKAILKVITNNYCSDSLFFSPKFKNDELLEEIEKIKSNKDYEIMSKSLSDSNDFDNSLSLMFDDTVTVSVESIRIAYYSSTKYLKRVNGKKIHQQCLKKQATRKQLPTLKISTPIISEDNVQAIVFTQYYCGPLCGSGEIIFLIKESDGWKIQNTSLRWIS